LIWINATANPFFINGPSDDPARGVLRCRWRPSNAIFAILALYVIFQSIRERLRASAHPVATPTEKHAPVDRPALGE
jgi:hypothetical protein